MFAMSKTIVIIVKKNSCSKDIVWSVIKMYGVAIIERIIAVTKKIVIELKFGDKFFFVKTLLIAHRNAAKTAKIAPELKPEGSGEMMIQAPNIAVKASPTISFGSCSPRDIFANKRMKIGVRQEIAMQLTAGTQDKA